MPLFATVTRDGDTLGLLELDRRDWPLRSVIYRRDEPNLRVVDRLEADDPETYTVLVVEAA